MPEQSQALAKFYWGFVEDGLADDGLPKFKDVLMIHLAVPPYTALKREATEEDVEMYPGPYAMFEKENKARNPKEAGIEGYPLSIWPVVTASQLAMLSARDIYTVQQLGALAMHPAMPGDLRELVERAKEMSAMNKNVAQHEKKLREANSQVAALLEQIEELKATIKVQDGTINSLRKAA